MLEKDRSFIRDRVLEVMNNWHVIPSNENEIEVWIDRIINQRGWEPYWALEEMPRIFFQAGYLKHD